MTQKNVGETVVLVTGASGFLASHVVNNLLKKGYRVRGTVRSLKNAAKISPIRSLDIDGRLELVEADLMKEEGWIDAVLGCDYILHVASPYPLVPDETTIPTAITGTINVLKAASKSPSVQKVVLTSSCLAIWEGHADNNRTFTDKDWTNVENPKVDLYSKSKALAEREAWKFHSEIPSGDNKFRFSVINPSFIIGPPLIDEAGSSVLIIKQLLEHDLPALPPMQVALVDVRDVAEAHVRAMNNVAADDERFITASQPSYWMKDMAKALSDEFKKHGYCVPCIEAPGVAIKFMGLFDKQAAAIKDKLSFELKCDNNKAKTILDMSFRNPDESLVAMGYACIERGLIKKAKNYKGVPEKYQEFAKK